MYKSCPNAAATPGVKHVGPGTCPEPDDTICPMYFSPVECNGCTYSNPCFAQAAGFGLGQCKPSGEMIPL